MSDRTRDHKSGGLQRDLHLLPFCLMVFEPQFPHYEMKTKILSSLSNRDFKTIPNNNWKHTNIQSNKHVEGITVVILRGSHTIRPTAFSL